VAGIVIYILYTLLSGNNIDPTQIQKQLSEQTEQSRQLTHEVQKADDNRASFVKVVMAETEDVWNNIFSEPTLVLFRGAVESACGNASSASGPFYCPDDSKLYIDLSFYQDL